MIHTRTISQADFPAVKALWEQLHAQAMDNNCWPGAPSDAMLAHLVSTHDWAVVEEREREAVSWQPESQTGSPLPASSSHLLGFTFWKLDPAGNAFVRAIAALNEPEYLHLVIAAVSASRTEAYGMLARVRPERTWFRNIGATFEPAGYEPLTPNQEAQCAARDEKLAARVPVTDKVIVPVSRLPRIRTRLEEIE